MRLADWLGAGMRDIPFEQAVRELAVARLRDSSEGRLNYQSWERSGATWWRFVRCLGLVWLVGSGGLGVVSLVAIAAGLPGVNGRPGLSHDWLLLTSSLVIASGAMLAAGANRGQLVMPRPVEPMCFVVPSHEHLIFLPLPDERIRWEVWRHTALVSICLFACLVMGVTGYWVFRAADGLPRVIIVPGFVVLSVAVALSMLSICYAHASLRASWRCVVGSAGALMLAVALLAGCIFGRSPPEIPRVALTVWLSMIPIGWVDLLFEQAVVQGNPLAWCWLLPIGGVLAWGAVLALEWYRAPCEIREFQVRRNRAQVIAPLVHGYRYCSENRSLGKAFAWPWFRYSRCSRTSPRDIVADALLSSSDDRSWVDWLQRLCMWPLSERERRMLPCWSLTSRRVAVRAVFLLASVILFSIVLTGLGSSRPPSRVDIGMPSSYILAVFVILFSRMAAWTIRSPKYPDGWVLLPVHFRESTWAALKYEMASAVASVPVLVLFALYTAWLRSESYTDSVAALFVPLLIPVLGRPLLDACKLGVMSRGFRGVLLLLSSVGVALAIGFAALMVLPYAYVVVQFWVQARWQVSDLGLGIAKWATMVGFLVGIGLISYLVWWFHGRVYDGGRLSLRRIVSARS